MSYTPTTDEVEHRYAYDELYSMDCEADHHAFRRWLGCVSAAVWDEAATEARDLGWLHDDAHADVVARNPYRQEQP